MSRYESRLRHNGCAVVLEVLNQELQVDLRAARLGSREEKQEQSNQYVLSLTYDIHVESTILLS